MHFDDFKTLCDNRRSIRYFAEGPLETTDILKLLELGRIAPSVHNLQPWRYHVINAQELRRKLMETSCYGDFVEGAGTFIVVTCDTSLRAPEQDPLWNPQELEYSCMAAMTQILLGATSLGLGSCWVSLHHGPAHEILGLPLNETIMGGIMVGKLKKGEEKASREHNRRPLSEMVKFYD